MTIRTSDRTRNTVLCLTIVIALTVLAGRIKSQDRSGNSQSEQQWSKSADERDSRIEIAKRGRYQIRYIFFSGHFGIRDYELRKRLLPGFNDGDVFDFNAFNESMKRLSKFKRIYPVTPEKIYVRLDEKDKWADFAIEIMEKGRSK